MSRVLLAFLCCCITSVAIAEESDSDTIWTRDTLLSDLGGVRSALGQRGLTVTLEDTNGFWSNVAGGAKQGTVYAGISTFGLAIDLDKAVGWHGARTYISAEWLRGSNPTALVGALQQVSQFQIGKSGLQDLWLEQDVWDRRMSIRIGQEQVNEEFLLSPYGDVMLNSTFTWPGLADANLPSSTANPMVRIALHPTDRVQLQAAVFKGTKGAARNALAIGEISYTVGLSSYRLGGFYQSGTFPDSRVEDFPHHGSASGYASIDQMLWHKPDTEDQGIAFFGRVIGGSNNLANLQIDAGVSWKGIVPHRDQDTLAVGASYLQLRPQARRQFAATTEVGLTPNEMVFELTYQAQVTGWLQVQPDFQYVIRPAGQLTPNEQPPHDAVLIAMQATIGF